MKFDELIDKEAYIENIDEAHSTQGTEYDRHWHEYTKEEKEKNPNLKGHGIWIYAHREAMGIDSSDDRVVHHKDENKHNNSPDNLEIVSRAEHMHIQHNAQKWSGHCHCKGCNGKIYSRGLCLKHYMQQFRSGSFGHYDKSKNKSKEER